MFNKTADPTAAPQRPASGQTAGRSVLASDLKINGEITSTGSIEIMGEVEGNLTARTLLVGAEGRMTGTVSAETVEVRGKLDGSVSTQSFTLRAAAAVSADINYTTLIIESGAEIEGHFARPKP
jgi:cytoskeletal protein CcmA (bactofilin family)